MTFSRVAVLGLGNVGHLAAELLQEASLEVVGFDAKPVVASDFEVKKMDVGNQLRLRRELSGMEAVLSCLPHDLNVSVAKTAHDLGIHYFDLTEDVSSARQTMELSLTAKALMAPQCGLAPGFVAIVAAHLEGRLENCRSLRLRAGALPQNPTGRLGYAFNWSPQGVVNEYLNDCEVIEDGVHKLISPMEWHETIYVAGQRLEAFTTSGGIGTMCSTYLGRVHNLDYKTLRYPGHVDLMNFFFHELLMRERRELSGEILVHAKPPVRDDVVYVHVAAEGTEGGKTRRCEFVRAFFPRRLCGRMRTAISWTTAVSVVGVMEMVRRGDLAATGFLRQEEVPFRLFSQTPTGSLIADYECDRPPDPRPVG